MLLVLIIAVQALVRWPHPMPTVLVVAGIALALAGLASSSGRGVTLGGAFTMFPEPKQRDVAGLVRPVPLRTPPMYGGSCCSSPGSGSPARCRRSSVVAALAVLWWRKSVEEERRLVRTFPGYDAYRRRTRHRFLPLSWPRGHAP